MLESTALQQPGPSLGRYLEPALWVLISLDRVALDLPAMLDAVRALDGPMGPGTLLGTVARLERLRLVESTKTGNGRVYRLTSLGRVAAGSTAVLKGRSA